jgi:BirA family biotin operon repressor/biotin-[acetyl-CoA-carboxylase] ligase
MDRVPGRHRLSAGSNLRNIRHPPTMAPIGEPFIVLDSVDSTNIHAMRLASGQDVAHGTVFFARSQTSGKGQRGRSWHSETDASILMSVVVDPIGMEDACGFPLVMATALAGTDLLREIIPDGVSVKWPNDLYWHDRKAGGILIENILRGGLCRRSVIGIGVNVNQAGFDESLPNPVSIRQATGLSHDAVALARRLCAALERRLDELASGGRQSMLSEYNGRLYRRGREMTFRDMSGRFSGIVQGVSAEGVLAVERPHIAHYRHGELEFVTGQG